MFQQAVKSQSYLRLAIAGSSGAGKTYTALRVATSIARNEGGRIAFVDTEHGSASKYADLFDFDTLVMEPPYKVERVIEAIQAAQRAGYPVLVIDSLSHFWNGSGGILEQVDSIAAARYKGNSFAAWKDVTPIYNRMVDTILGSGLHVIGCMRAKQEYALEGEGGKSRPVKVGLAPIQREGLEYEFDVVLQMQVDNNAAWVTKTRCPALQDKTFVKPGDDLADILWAWLRTGQQAPAAPDPVAQFLRRYDEASALGMAVYVADWPEKGPALALSISKGRTNVISELDEGEMAKLVAGIRRKATAKQLETAEGYLRDLEAAESEDMT